MLQYNYKEKVYKMKSDRKDRVKEQKLVERDVVVINPLPIKP